jgi:hypothetical protein
MLSEAKHLAVETVLTRAHGEILRPRPGTAGVPWPDGKRGLRMTILFHLP